MSTHPLCLHELQHYQDVTQKQLSSPAKLILQYLIGNPEIGADGLRAILRSPTVTASIQVVKEALCELKRYDRLKEIPVFQTRDEFQAVVDQECALDELMLDFDTEEGRNNITRKYQSLVHKIVRGYLGKSNLDYDELLSAAYMGLTQAMNKYANKDRVEIDPETGLRRWVSFSVYAAQQIKFYIMEDIKQLSHTVRVPISRQSAERKSQGYNTRCFTVSGDETISSDSHSKSRFDLMGIGQEDSKGLNGDLVEEMWNRLIEILREHFHRPNFERDLSIFLDAYGIHRDDVVPSKVLCAQHGICASNVTRIKKEMVKCLSASEEAREIVCYLLSMYDSNEPVASLILSA